MFSKEKLEKAILERADATSRSKSLECSLQMAQDELKRFEEQNEQHKQEIQQLVQSLEERRNLIAEFELKFQVKTSHSIIFFRKKKFFFSSGFSNSMY